MSEQGYFSGLGGKYVPEVLQAPLIELEEAFTQALQDATFWQEFHYHADTFIGRPTPLLFAQQSTEVLGGAKIYIKLEGLANTGAHKINNVLGQCLLAKRMGKKRIIAETGAGQHGAATAACCAKLGLECHIYMGAIDVQRQRPNVHYMQLYNAHVIPVYSGTQTLKDAINEALRDWTDSFSSTHYLIGSVLGPVPYPDMVREFQSIIGKETKQQLEKTNEHPDVMIASVGGGSNAIGFFSAFLNDTSTRLIGVEAGGDGNYHASRITGGAHIGIVHGYKSLFLMNQDGQLLPTHSIAAGLDYPGIGPQLAALGKEGRIEFMRTQDHEAWEAVLFFAQHEGLLFALESAHAGYQAIRIAKELSSQNILVIHMSGRGEKDMFISAAMHDRSAWVAFLKEELDRLST